MDGDLSFLRGMQSSLSPIRISEGGICWGMNIVNRGGVIQCRPGFTTRLCLPEGNLQGLARFRARRAASEQLVFAIAGKVYVSSYPFNEYSQLPNIVLSPLAKRVEFCTTEHTVTRNQDGSIAFIAPRFVLFMQDGLSACAYYNGAENGHVSGLGQTPQGEFMAFSGDRLWVAREERLFASDIGNPFSFVEDAYLGGSDSFILPGLCTGLVELPSISSPNLLAFTASSTSMFLSSIRARDTWATTVGFQSILLPTIGCVASRSITTHYGLLWWFSQHGLTRFDAAIQTQSSSKLDYVDNELALSKSRLDGDLSGTAGASFENYLLMSVPYADQYNRHTWVFDESGMGQLEDGGTKSSWNGFWTGVRPVQWAGGQFNSVARLFFVSKDYDGQNRLWEAFSSERRDNNCDITWAFCSRAYAGKSIQTKTLRFAELLLAELRGTVDIKLSWAGALRGRFKAAFTKRIVATEGSLEAGREIGDDIYAFRSQSRRVRTPELNKRGQDEATSCGVETPLIEAKDEAFMFLFQGCGPGAVRGIRVFMDTENDIVAGECPTDETEENVVRFDGAAMTADTVQEAIDNLSNIEPESYTSIQSVAATVRGIPLTGSGIAESPISQASADKVATQMANAVLAFRAVASAPEILSPYEYTPSIPVVTPPWNPLDETGLVAWFKSDVGLVLIGSQVIGWLDQSGRGRDLSAPLAKCPTFLANQINGLPAVSFSQAISTYLASETFSLAQPVSIYLVAKLRTYTQFRRLISGFSDSYLYCSNVAAPNISMRTGGSVGPTYTTWQPGTYAVVFSAWSGAASKIWKDRQLTAGGNPGTGVFDGIVMGSGPSPFALGSDIDIVELIVRSGVDTAVQQSRHNSYLQSRIGTSFNNLVAEGDDITQGAGLADSNLYPTKFVAAKSPALWGYANQAVSLDTTITMLSRANFTDAMLDTRNASNWLTVLCGKNNLLVLSMSAADTFSQLAEYCQYRRAAGWKVGICTLLPSTIPGYNALRNAVNALIVANWTTFADALIDLAANPDIGPDLAAGDLTYYSDGSHLTATGQTRYATVVAAALP